MTKVVILAAGRGSRMRASRGRGLLSAAQQLAARQGLKALVPIERPFLDYLLSRLADAGCRRVCLVTAPHHQEIRDYYLAQSLDRLEIVFAVQPQPRGTADALMAAESFIERDEFLMLNSDNCYPTSALRMLSEMKGEAVVGFESGALVRQSNIPADRVCQLSVLRATPAGFLESVIEKPSPEQLARLKPPVLVGLNCWRFAPEILQDCRGIDWSARGELELPAAVMHALRKEGRSFRLIASREGVLDLSCPADVAGVEGHLRGQEVRL